MSQQTNTSQEPSSAVSSTETQSVSLNKSHIVNLCAVGLFASFFLPWINFLGMKPSLFDAAKRGGGEMLYWALPIFSALTIFASVTKRGPKIVAQVTGAIPFIILGHSVYREGQDFLRILDFGAYLGLCLGLVLFILPRNSK